jgi:hypothetical protein
MDQGTSDSLNKVSYAEVVEEVKRLQGLLLMYKNGDPLLPSDFNYRNTLFALRHYKLKLSCWKKSERNS